MKTVGLTGHTLNQRSIAARSQPEPEPEPAKVELWEEPEDGIVLLGYMIQESEFIRKTLSNLPFSKGEYRGDLRQTLSATMRMEKRLKFLLGEGGNG